MKATWLVWDEGPLGLPLLQGTMLSPESMKVPETVCNDEAKTVEVSQVFAQEGPRNCPGGRHRSDQ